MPASLIIRLARPSERESLEALQRRASLANEGDRAALLAHPEAIELRLAHIESGGVLVAERDGAVLGFSVVLPRDDDAAELEGLFVEPGIWRQGVGRALVDAACAHALRNGAPALHVIANPHASAFYDACSFEPLGEVQMRFGSATAMRKPLRRNGPC